MFYIALLDASASEQQDLFIKKLQQCCVIFNFLETVEDLQARNFANFF